MKNIVPKLNYFLLSSVVIFNSCDYNYNDSRSGGISPENVYYPYPTSPPKLSQNIINEYLKVINEQRTKEEGQVCGIYGHFDPVQPLKWSDELYNASYEHSYDMAKSDWFNHKGSGSKNDLTSKQQNLKRGSNPIERIENNNYINWLHLGENIAAGTDMKEVSKAVDKWMKSQEHCKNMMNPYFKEVGLSMVYDKDSFYKYYWTQNFGESAN